MKKIYFIIALLVVGFFSTTTFAQKSMYDTSTSFKPGWFIGANGGINWFLAEGNDIFDDKYDNLLSEKIGYQVNGLLGYNFSPVHALRGVFGYHQFKYNTESGINLKIPHGKLNLDYVLNLTNLAKGYDPERVFTFSLYAGIGGAYIDRNTDNSKIGGILRGGLQGDFHLNPKLALSIMLDQNLLTDNFNDQVTKRAFDMNTGLTLGLTYRFQKDEPVKEVPPALVEPVAPAPVEKPVEKPVEPEKPKVVEPVKPEPVKEIPTMKEEVFFKINKTSVEGTEHEEIIKRSAEYLQNNPEAKIIVSGYADAKTGSEKVNEKISMERAQNATKVLVEKYGVDSNKITTNWFGSTVQPYEENWKNRTVIIETNKEK